MMEENNSMEAPGAAKKKKLPHWSKLARLQRSRLNKSKGSMNVSFNTSRIRQTLKANNKQLARALTESRTMINTLRKQNIELQSNNQKLITDFNNLKHLSESELIEQQIEQEVEARFQIRMKWLMDIVNKMSSQFVSLVETFTELNYTSKFNTRSSSSCPDQQSGSRLSQPIRTSNILEKVMKASRQTKEDLPCEKVLPTEDELGPSPDVQHSPEVFLRQPCSSNPDLSVILETTNLFENSMLTAEVNDKGERYSRVSRRTAMTDFSTLKEFQDVEESPEGVEELPKTQSSRSHESCPKVTESTHNIPSTEDPSDTVLELQCSEESMSSDQPDLPTVAPVPETKASRRSVRKSRRISVRDSSQDSHSEMSESEDVPAAIVDSDAEIVVPESPTEENVPAKNTAEEDCEEENQGEADTSEKHKPTHKGKRVRRGTFEVKDAPPNDSSQKDSTKPESPQTSRTLRRETFALPEAPADKPASPEKAAVSEKQDQSKEDRRGTFVVAPKSKGQVHPAKPLPRKRRGTYNLEEDGIIQQTSEVLITDDVLDDIESLDNELPQVRNSPPRSSIATSEGDTTINEVMDMELTTAINSTIINAALGTSDPKKNVVKKSAAVAEKPNKPASGPVKTVSSRSKQKDRAANVNSKQPETSAPTADNDKGKNVYKAWLSKPGRITFTAGRKDLNSLAKEGTQKSRSKQKSIIPKKPRSKTGRSKPRLMPDMSPKTVFDFSGTPRNAVQSSKSVYDMSLNESVTGTKQTYQDFKEKPCEGDSRPTLKMVKERFAKEEIEEATVSPHGIMLVLGDGKRTKPRSKKQVSYSGKLTETHLRTPQASTSGTSESQMCIEDASKTPPGRASRRRVSEPSNSDDDTIIVGMPDEVMPVDEPESIPSEEEVVADPELEVIESQAPTQEASVLYEENVKIMPDNAATPTPLKRLQGRKFTSTEEEMRALFESSLLKTPVTAQPKPSQRPEKEKEPASSEQNVVRNASGDNDSEKSKKSLKNDNFELKEEKKDEAEKPKKSRPINNQNEDSRREKHSGKSEVSKQRPSKSPSRGKVSEGRIREASKSPRRGDGAEKPKKSRSSDSQKEKNTQEAEVPKQRPSKSPSRGKVSDGREATERREASKSPRRRDDSERPKKSRSSDNQKENTEEADVPKQRPSKSPSRGKISDEAKPAERQQTSKSPGRRKASVDAKKQLEVQDFPDPLELPEAEENMSPIPKKAAKKKSTKSTKRSRSKVTDAVTPQKENEVESEFTGEDQPVENITPVSAGKKGRKRGSSQIVHAAEETISSPKSKGPEKFDNDGFAIPVGSPPKRRRRGTVVSYKEPSLNSKMRKGEKEGTIFINNQEVKNLVGAEKDGERKKSTDKRTVLKEIECD